MKVGVASRKLFTVDTNAVYDELLNMESEEEVDKRLREFEDQPDFLYALWITACLHRSAYEHYVKEKKEHINE